MDFSLLQLLASALLGGLLLFILIALIVIYVVSEAYPNLHRHEDEKYFFDPASKNRKLFPNIFENPSIELSVIFPAYNEEERIHLALDDALLYLQNRKKNNPSFTYEVIVVDDGSRDKTSNVVLENYVKKHSTDVIRVLTLTKNRGKGGAVRLGVLSCRGRHILFADADGATKFSDVEKLEKSLKELNEKNPDSSAIVCGSRAHLEDDAIATRSVFRTFLMKGFHFLVWFLCVRGIRDTQCGFKLLTRKAAVRTFTNMHVERWAFDVDLLYVAQRLRIPITEVAVTWHEVEGSKIIPFWSWLQMGRDILLIRVRYMIGAWKIKENKD